MKFTVNIILMRSGQGRTHKFASLHDLLAYYKLIEFLRSMGIAKCSTELYTNPAESVLWIAHDE